MIKAKRHGVGLIVLIAVFAASLLGVLGVAFSSKAYAAVGEVFDYASAEKTVKYKAYQSDPSDKTARKGLLLYAYDRGASVAFKTSFNGEFSAELTASANNELSVETKSYSLLFTDITTKKQFAVTISNKASGKDVCVVYDGQKAGIHYYVGSTYKLLGLSGEYNAVDEYTSFSSQTAYIVFDPDAMEVKLRLDDGIERPVWNFSNTYNDGKKLENDLPTFGEYTVSVVFDEIKANSKGEILIYSFGGYSFGTQSAEFKPTVKADVSKSAVVGKAYEVPVATVLDPFKGNLDSSSVTVDVYDADGKILNNGGYSFTPGVKGKYYLYYTYRNDGVKSTAYYAIDAIAASEVQTNYYFEQELDDSVTIGQYVSMYIPKAVVESSLFASSASKRAIVNVYKDGTLVRKYKDSLSGFTYTFNSCGDYVIEYSSPVDLGDYAVKKSFNVKVDKNTLGVVLSEEVPETLAQNAKFNVPVAKMHVGGNSYTAMYKLVYPSGTESAKTENVLSETGTYKIVYSYESYSYEVSFDVKQTYADLFTGESGANGTFEEVVANNETTGVKLSLKENERFTYQKVIDLSDNVFDENLVNKFDNDLLIEMYAQPKKIDSSDVDALFIVLTDAHDSSNYIEIRMKYLSYSNQGVYIRTRASGQSNWIGYNYDFWTTDLAVHYATTHEEGGFYEYFSMTHEMHDVFENMALRLYFDNETLCLYGEPAWKYAHTANGEDKSVVTPWLIRDFKTTDTNLSMGNKPWGGFTNGEVILSVYAKGVSDHADFYITEIDGVSLSDEFIEPSAPVINVDFKGNSSAAYALVNKAYKLPEYTVIKGDSEIISQNAEVYRVESGVLTSKVRVTNGKFTPATATTYAIVYSAVDSYGAETKEIVYVQAKSSIDEPMLSVDLSSLPETAAYGEVIKLPVAEASGGAGWATVEYSVQNGGNTITVENGTFKCLGTGDFVVTVKAVDYVGQVVSKTATIKNVALSDKPVFDAEEILIPPAFMVGDTFTFSEYIAVSYDANRVGTDVAAKIEVSDGSGTHVIGADRKYTPDFNAATDAATVKFIFGEGYDALVIEKQVPVLLIKNGNGFLTNYFVTENAEKTTDQHNVNFTATDTKKDMSLSFIRPIDARKLNVQFGINAEMSNYETISVIFRDIYDASAVAELKFRSSGTSVYASLNGGTEASVKVSNGAIQIKYSAETKQFADSLGVAIGTFKGGFKANSVYLTIKANGVYGETRIGVKNINNQTINLINRDLQKPAITLSNEFEGRYAAGSKVVIPAAYAYDVLSSIGEVIVKISDEATGEVYLEQSAMSDITFTPENLGYYKVVYSVKDSAGNNGKLEKIFTVYDAVKPSITFKSDIPQVVDVGSTIALPDYVLADNYSINDLIVRVYFFTPDGMSQRVTNNTVKFETKGYYSVNYLVMDANNNIMTYSFAVRAK